MGPISSKESFWVHFCTYYGEGSPFYVPRNSYASSQSYPPPQPEPRQDQNRGGDKRTKDRRSSRTADDYGILDLVADFLAKAGFGPSRLIVGIDFTESNKWTEKRSFNRKSLHYLGNSPNPFEQAISMIGEGLASFLQEILIHCFGFGDASTHDRRGLQFLPRRTSL